MILVDSSVWIDHLRGNDPTLADLLNRGQVLTHSFVIGELALGSLRQRAAIIDALRSLPRASLAIDDEVIAFIDANGLFGRGIGYIDAHLLASARLTPGTTLWTRDKRLNEIALVLGVAFVPPVIATKN
jgi:predicted nucleic acid-binding protein